MMSDLLNKKLSRRSLLRIGGCAGVTVAACGVTGVIVGTQTDLLDRLQGISKTPLLENADAWQYTDPRLTLQLDLIPDLNKPGSAVRLEDDSLPEPLLIVHGADDDYYVYINKCPHGGRRIDPDGGNLRCTSISRSSFDYTGKVLGGPAKSPLTAYEVEQDETRLLIRLL